MPTVGRHYRFAEAAHVALKKHNAPDGALCIAGFKHVQTQAVPESLPLDHQQVSQARVVKGICGDRFGHYRRFYRQENTSFARIKVAFSAL